MDAFASASLLPIRFWTRLGMFWMEARGTDWALAMLPVLLWYCVTMLSRVECLGRLPVDLSRFEACTGYLSCAPSPSMRSSKSLNSLYRFCSGAFLVPLVRSLIDLARLVAEGAP